jgi:uncharacterized protein (DUF1697 family)
VGGSGVLPMKGLVGILEALGFGDIKTYIQSGNVVFRARDVHPSTISREIRAEIQKRFGFEPQVLLLEPTELKEVIDSNPFPEAESEPKTLHLYFLPSVPGNPDLRGLDRIRGESERVVLEGNVLYLHAPEGIGRSKLAAKVEKLLGVPATGRNWRTVTSIMALVEEGAGSGGAVD